MITFAPTCVGWQYTLTCKETDSLLSNGYNIQACPEEGGHDHMMAALTDIPSSRSIDTSYMDGSYMDKVTMGMMGTRAHHS